MMCPCCEWVCEVFLTHIIIKLVVISPHSTINYTIVENLAERAHLIWAIIRLLFVNFWIFSHSQALASRSNVVLCDEIFSAFFFQPIRFFLDLFSDFSALLLSLCAFSGWDQMNKRVAWVLYGWCWDFYFDGLRNVVVVVFSDSCWNRENPVELNMCELHSIDSIFSTCTFNHCAKGKASNADWK